MNPQYSENSVTMVTELMHHRYTLQHFIASVIHFLLPSSSFFKLNETIQEVDFSHPALYCKTLFLQNFQNSSVSFTHLAFACYRFDLTNTHHRVAFGTHRSAMAGVPQGAVLTALLFISSTLLLGPIVPVTGSY